MAPLAAFTMAGIVFLYTRSSIKAAKLSVQQNREQGGGKVNWRVESMRNHGQISKTDDYAAMKEAVLGPPKSASKLGITSSQLEQP